MIGKTLGQYEVIEKVGAGGMGDVYRARDTKLDRIVAIKVLPEVFAIDGDRLARFEREARLLASLNHPHIATIYDLKKVDGVHFLAMEFIEGDDLAQRLARGPMPSDEAARVGAQIAEALEVAHENGVIHRDLKPANIKFAADGNAKVLDFGLAKAMDADDGNSDMTNSPTITSGGTAAGVILGTAAYMSPEQARGRAVDKRTDIWAFGGVLFEMLTGRQVFTGETVSDTIACILQREPDWTSLPGNAPPRVRRLLERCLEKDAKRRLRDIGEARIELEDMVADSQITAAPAIQEKRGRLHPVVWAAVGLAIGMAAMFAATLPGGGDRAVPLVSRLSVKPPDEVVMHSNAVPTVSRDGRVLAYAAQLNAEARLFLRNLGSFETRMLADINAVGPFFSPDGRWVAFRSSDESGTRLMRVSVEGGTPLPICEVRGGPGSGVWTEDDQLILAESLVSGLVTVPVAGGTPVSLTTPDSADGELGHWAPCALPDDDHVLFTAWRTRMDDARIKAVSRSTGEIKVVVQNGVNPMFVEPGYLLYTLGATLMCVPFDPERVEVTGDPVPVIDPAQVSITDGVTTAAVAGGTLCYFQPEDYQARLLWADLDGNVEPVVDELRDYDGLSLSPDGTRIAIDIEQNGKSDIWVIDLQRSSRTQLTVDGTNGVPIFTPDGRTVTFQSMRRGPFEIYTVGAGGGSSPELLFPSERDISPSGWTPDGSRLLFGDFSPETKSDVMQFVAADGSISPAIQTGFSEGNARVSPDGRWVAYVVYGADAMSVYVSSISGADRFQVSVNGGSLPLWAPDGRALYFIDPVDGGVNRVDVVTDPAFRASRPRVVLTQDQLGGYVESYDIHPDGKRLVFVINRDMRGKRTYRVILNFDQELEGLFQ